MCNVLLVLSVEMYVKSIHLTMFNYCSYCIFIAYAFKLQVNKKYI